MEETKKSVRHRVCEEALIIAAEEMYKLEVENPGLEDVMIGPGTNFEYANREEWLSDIITQWLEQAATRLGV